MIPHICYSAIIGDIDQVYDPLFVQPNFRYILFTNNPNLKSKIWEIKIVEDENLPNRRLARKIKIRPDLFLPEHKVSVWQDANFQQKRNIRSLLGWDFLTSKHPDRNCVYQEARVCRVIGNDDPELIQNQIRRYYKDGLPLYIGLYESGLLIRRSTIENQRFNALWWDELSNGSLRDQISMPYCLWKLKMNVKVIHDRFRYYNYYEHANAR